MISLLSMITTNLFFPEEFETRERSESQLSAHRYTEPLTILDKSSNINRSITSDSTNVSEKDVIADAEKRAKEDNKMIKEEKAETGRVCSIRTIIDSSNYFLSVLFCERQYSTSLISNS
jgi:hypothetical protein